jgi:hypothetical protein
LIKRFVAAGLSAFAAELLHDLQVMLHIQALQVDGTGELLDVYHARQVSFREAQHRERPARAGVAAVAEPDHLEDHVQHCGCLHEAAGLGAHDPWAAGRRSTDSSITDQTTGGSGLLSRSCRLRRKATGLRSRRRAPS